MALKEETFRWLSSEKLVAPKRDNIHKNIRTPVDLRFSIQKIQCKGCGGSFDATKQRTCPSCGKRYEMEDDDWVILKIRKH